jgi:P27 family predicted phage terminase small subunit
MPAAKPAALKLLNGRGPGKDSAGRPVNVGPGYVRDAPEPPGWLGPLALEEWRRVVPELSRLRMLARVSRSSLVAYCETWELYERATRQLHDEGLTIEAKQGRLSNPLVGIQRATGAELRKWASEYGLTPVSEQKVKAGESADDGDDLLD